MARHNPGQRAYEDPNLFTGGEIGAERSHPVKRGFWVNLFLSQPLLMLGGMWMLFVLIAVLAFGGLLDPGLKDLPKLTPMEQSRVLENKRSAAKESTDQDTQPADPTDIQPTPAPKPNATDNSLEVNGASQRPGPSIPIWSLAALVLTCAVGCRVINHYLNAPPSPPVKNRRQPQPIKPSRPTFRSLKRLKPYVAPTATSLQTTGKIQRLPEPATNVNSPNPSSADAKPVVTTVVPPTESNPLDWPDGSLAHQLDLRQQKSLSSWL